MHILELDIQHFKNHRHLRWILSKGIHLITGANGSGKTALLDAIHCVCLTKSAFHTPDEQLVTFGESYYLLKAMIEQQDRQTTVSLGWQKGTGKAVATNGKTEKSLAHHIGKYPVVMISPFDSDLIRMGSELRRKLFDSILSQSNTHYLSQLVRYNQLLNQKNALLKWLFESGKKRDNGLLEVYDEQLAKLNTDISHHRLQFIQAFSPIFLSSYNQLSNLTETPSLEYASEVHLSDATTALLGSRERDIVAGRSTWGVHRDDYDFKLNGNFIRKIGSQGQQKTYSIALKLALFEFLKSSTGSTPILLLDDIFDKLDDQRIASLLSKVDSNTFGQLFITDARPERSIDLLHLKSIPFHSLVLT